MTAANNPYLLHSELLSYGLINWVTKGVFIGQRHVNLDAQVDDLLIDDDISDTAANSDLTGLTYRMTGIRPRERDRLADAHPGERPLARERAARASPSTAKVQYGIYSPDTLTPAVVASRGAFNWVSHTYSHQNLDSVDYSDARRELVRNNTAATMRGLPVPEGRPRPARHLRAVESTVSAGREGLRIRYLISDTSRPGGANPTRTRASTPPLSRASWSFLAGRRTSSTTSRRLHSSSTSTTTSTAPAAPGLLAARPHLLRDPRPRIRQPPWVTWSGGTPTRSCSTSRTSGL